VVANIMFKIRPSTISIFHSILQFLSFVDYFLFFTRFTRLMSRKKAWFSAGPTGSAHIHKSPGLLKNCTVSNTP